MSHHDPNKWPESLQLWFGLYNWIIYFFKYLKSYTTKSKYKSAPCPNWGRSQPQNENIQCTICRHFLKKKVPLTTFLFPWFTFLWCRCCDAMVDLKLHFVWGYAVTLRNLLFWYFGLQRNFYSTIKIWLLLRGTDKIQLLYLIILWDWISDTHLILFLHTNCRTQYCRVDFVRLFSLLERSERSINDVM